MNFNSKHLKRMILAVFMLLMAWFFAFADVVQADINTGLVACYPFNGNANDASGNGHNGTINGATSTNDRFNNPNSAYSFDGVDDYISIPNHSDFNLSGDYAFSLWIYQKSAITNGSFRILDKATGGTCNGWNLDTYDGSTGRRIRLDVSCPWRISNTLHSLNTWHHVVASVHAGYVTFYLNGNTDGGGSIVATPINSLDVYVGAAHPSGASFDGFIDDVRIYNRALSEAEVQALYAGDNFTLDFQGSGSGTVIGNGLLSGSQSSFSTNTGTTEQFDFGSILQLHGDPDNYNIFTGWSGDCSGETDCNLTMTTSRNVNAIFDIYTDHKTRIGDSSSYYTSLQAAYDNSPDSGTIKAWATDYVENLHCNQAKNVTLEGGYNEGYISNTGYTTLKGNLTIANGSLTCDRFIISACNGSCSYYTISGKIAHNGTGLGGVSVRLSGASASLITTDSDGNYAFTGLSNGTYTITPSLAGYTITPQQATINSSNVALNFTTTPITYSISGRITYNSNGLSGVAVALIGTSTANTMTDSSGNYSFTGLGNGAYTVTPTLAGYTITPQQVTVNGANITTNFTATWTGHSITGRITLSGTGFSGVAVALTGAGTTNTTTDSNGDYSFTGLANGSYTITPSLTGYLFTPSNLSATVSNADVTGENFAATLNSITHPSSLVGTWSTVDNYTEDSDGEAPYTDPPSNGTLNSDGTISNGIGAWAYYKNMLATCSLYDNDDVKGIMCYYFRSLNAPISGLLEERELDGSNWWGRGNVDLTYINSTGGSDQLHLHPANLVGNWSVAANYTSSSSGTPSSYNSTETVTLNADGTVSSRGAAIGFWFSDGDVFGVGYFWDKAAESGFKCHFMNLSGTTSASGYIEDKQLIGSLWWGRGNVSMTKQ